MSVSCCSSCVRTMLQVARNPACHTPLRVSSIHIFTKQEILRPRSTVRVQCQQPLKPCTPLYPNCHNSETRNPTRRLMDKILHDPKDPKLWEVWYIPYYGSCRILSMSPMSETHKPPTSAETPSSGSIRWVVVKIMVHFWVLL